MPMHRRGLYNSMIKKIFKAFKLIVFTIKSFMQSRQNSLSICKGYIWIVNQQSILIMPPHCTRGLYWLYSVLVRLFERRSVAGSAGLHLLVQRPSHHNVRDEGKTR